MGINIDKYGYFYEEDKYFFHVGDVTLMHLNGKELHMTVSFSKLLLSFETIEKAKEIFDMVRVQKVERYEAGAIETDGSKARSQAQLLMQAKILEKFSEMHT